MRILIGIVIGGIAAMMFPEHAGQAYEFVRELINTAATAIVDATRGY